MSPCTFYPFPRLAYVVLVHMWDGSRWALPAELDYAAAERMAELALCEPDVATCCIQTRLAVAASAA